MKHLRAVHELSKTRVDVSESISLTVLNDRAQLQGEFLRRLPERRQPATVGVDFVDVVSARCEAIDVAGITSRKTTGTNRKALTERQVHRSAEASTHAVTDDFNGTLRAGTNDAGAYAFDPGGNPGWTISPGFKDETPVPPMVDAAPGTGPDASGPGGDGGGGCCQTGRSDPAAPLASTLLVVLGALATRARRSRRACRSRGTPS